MEPKDIENPIAEEDFRSQIITEKMENTKLKSCPFCGGESELISRGNEFSKKRSAEITCNTCSVKMVVAAISHSLEWCRGKITEKWNRRISI